MYLVYVPTLSSCDVGYISLCNKKLMASVVALRFLDIHNTYIYGMTVRHPCVPLCFSKRQIKKLLFLKRKPHILSGQYGFSFTKCSLEHSSLPLFINYMFFSFWLASSSSVHPITVSLPTRSLMRELRVYKIPNTVL
jgi:hypothetical protein